MEITKETLRVSKDLADLMKDIPRHFNETLTDWAIRCQILRRYQAPPSPQAPVGEKLLDYQSH